jgi:hypothetical protein
MCNNDNDSVINNNCERLKNLILLLKIPMGRKKNFFEIYKQIGTQLREGSQALL